MSKAASVQAVWDKASEGVKARYIAFNGGSEFDAEDVYPDVEEFKDILKAMEAPFYCEQANEYDMTGVIGVKTEEEALDTLVDGGDKYGDWRVFQYVNVKWLEAKIKRKGKAVDLVWADYEY